MENIQIPNRDLLLRKYIKEFDNLKIIPNKGIEYAVLEGTINGYHLLIREDDDQTDAYIQDPEGYCQINIKSREKIAVGYGSMMLTSSLGPLLASILSGGLPMEYGSSIKNRDNPLLRSTYTLKDKTFLNDLKGGLPIVIVEVAGGFRSKFALKRSDYYKNRRKDLKRKKVRRSAMKANTSRKPE